MGSMEVLKGNDEGINLRKCPIIEPGELELCSVIASTASQSAIYIDGIHLNR